MSSSNSSRITGSPTITMQLRCGGARTELAKILRRSVHAVSPEVATWLTAAGRAAMAAGITGATDRRWHRVVERASLRAGPPTVHNSEIVPAAAVPTLVDMSKDAKLMGQAPGGRGWVIKLRAH